jgi:uncharacterized membrane protein YccC
MMEREMLVEQPIRFTTEEAKIIYEALRHARPTQDRYPEPRERHSEAMQLVAAELQRVGEFAAPRGPWERM